MRSRGARAGVQHDQPSTQGFCFAGGDPGCDGGVERGCRVGAGGGASFVVVFLLVFFCLVLVFFGLFGAGDLDLWGSGDACDCE